MTSKDVYSYVLTSIISTIWRVLHLKHYNHDIYSIVNLQSNVTIPTNTTKPPLYEQLKS